MKVSTKIVYGFGILIALMAALILFQVLLINQMQTSIQNLSSVNFEVASLAVDLSGTMRELDATARKAIELGDPDYQGKYNDLRARVEADLAHLDRIARSEKERAEVSRLSKYWVGFLRDFQQELEERQAEGLIDFPATLSDHLQQLLIQTENVYRASSEVIALEARKSLDSGEDVKVLSGVAAAIALVLSLIVSFVIVQSISIPLKLLTQGTRAIAQGKFFYRLDTSHKDEFSQLAKDFNTMTERLNELDQMKKDFVSHVSHELKAPLASMQETVQLLLDKVPGDLTEKQRRLLELNLQSGRRLSSLIGNLLDMSRLEAGVMEYELRGNDVGELARTALEETEALARDKKIRLRLETASGALAAQCDGDRIIQVLKNLISNAIKFSPAESEVLVRASTIDGIPERLPEDRRQSLMPSSGGRDHLLVEVLDSGSGVPEEHREKIFEKFHQVKQGRKLPGQGAGLGLAISRTIVEAHQGAIWMEANPAGGSIFRVLLPLAEITPQEGVKSASAPIE